MVMVMVAAGVAAEEEGDRGKGGEGRRSLRILNRFVFYQ